MRFRLYVLQRSVSHETVRDEHDCTHLQLFGDRLNPNIRKHGGHSFKSSLRRFLLTNDSIFLLILLHRCFIGHVEYFKAFVGGYKRSHNKVIVNPKPFSFSTEPLFCLLKNSYLKNGSTNYFDIL